MMKEEGTTTHNVMKEEEKARQTITCSVHVERVVPICVSVSRRTGSAHIIQHVVVVQTLRLYGNIEAVTINNKIS